MIISETLKSVLDFIFPDSCVLCGADTDGRNLSVCRECIDKIEIIKPPFCKICRQPVPGGGTVCWQCRKTKYNFENIIAVGKYTGVLRELILKFKEKDSLKKVLGYLLADELLKNRDALMFDFIVPVPLSRKKEFQRDYNQSLLLAKIVAAKLKGRVVDGSLVRIKNTKPQYELSRNERQLNLNDAFFVKNPSLFNDKRVLLIDDIATSCSTLEECSRVLKKAGAKKIYCAVLARD